MKHDPIWPQVSLRQPNVITVGVTFDGGRSGQYYTYKTYDETIKEMDFAVVMVRNELKIVQVMEVHQKPKIDPNAGFRYLWLINKVDLDNYNKLNEIDNQLYKHIKEQS